MGTVTEQLASAFRDGRPRSELLADGLDVIGAVPAPVWFMFLVPDATPGELHDQAAEVSLDRVLVAPDHEIAWGEYQVDGGPPQFWCLALRVVDGRVTQAMPFDDLDAARWYAGL